jgi:hypothetical protein
VKQDALTVVPVWVFEDGRRVRLSLAERERRLMRPGERWVGLDELAEARRDGWVPVEVIWHGERGSWREGWGGQSVNSASQARTRSV